MTKGNTTGGKNYKKSKHGGQTKSVYPERQADQMWARVIRNLGNRNMLCYCNDGRQRLCHVRGSMRNRVWINVGDIIIISLREISGAESEKGDIIAKVDTEHHHRMKSEPGVNQNLFLQVETMEAKTVASAKDGENLGVATDGFEFEQEEKPQKEEEEEDSDVDVDDI